MELTKKVLQYCVSFKGEMYQAFTDSYFLALIKNEYLPIESVPADRNYPPLNKLIDMINYCDFEKSIKIKDITYIYKEGSKTQYAVFKDEEFSYINKQFIRSMIQFLGLKNNDIVNYSYYKHIFIFRSNKGDYCLIVPLIIA